MPKIFGAGKLRHVIKIQQRTETRDTFGSAIFTWTDLSSSVRARVVPINMSESFSDPQMVSQETKEFQIRYRSGVSPKDRIIYKSETYNIEEIINEEERDHKLNIRASKVNT